VDLPALLDQREVREHADDAGQDVGVGSGAGAPEPPEQLQRLLHLPLLRVADDHRRPLDGVLPLQPLEHLHRHRQAPALDVHVDQRAGEDSVGRRREPASCHGRVNLRALACRAKTAAGFEQAGKSELVRLMLMLILMSPPHLPEHEQRVPAVAGVRVPGDHGVPGGEAPP
jgi:hypothetical protein